VPLAPLVGSVVLPASSAPASAATGSAGACRTPSPSWAWLIAFVISAMTLKSVAIDGARFNATLYEWMVVGGLKMEVGFLVDGLTAMMMCVVTFVSLMVHIYTIGYMEEDDGYNRFFAYISLFTFSMLMLVMSNNFLQLFFGWEAVGLVSYLLIGFWFNKPTAIFANMKAFLVNRVGDFGFILGIGLIAAYAGTLNYGEAFAKADELAKLTFPGTGWMLITVICICLFIGAMGKSAQFPLHVWLPDSMEGPTPISALIHAATMVTAGIFMVARMSPLFELSDTALSFILVIGAITALFMGFLGIIQNDIKRVVAYSTLSQLGYMTVALGASAYSVAVFHLMTHAFFKALLFLAAGSVIIGMHHNQDIRWMGGVRKYMPVTWITSLLGSLALIGTPLFAGFYSKDSIIEAVHLSKLPGAGFAYFAVMAGVFVTAFYSFRMYFLVFHGKERYDQNPDAHGHGDDHARISPTRSRTSRTTTTTAMATAHDAHGHDAHGHEKPHESPWVVTRCRWWLLAIPSVLIGYLFIGPDAVRRLLQGFDLHRPREASRPGRDGQGIPWPGGDGAARPDDARVLAGRWPAWRWRTTCTWSTPRCRRSASRTRSARCTACSTTSTTWTGSTRTCWRAARAASASGCGRVATRPSSTARLVNGSAHLVGWFSGVARRLQTGYIYHYALAMIVGVFVLMTWFVWLNFKAH
jgi:NADH-quinone oxidoreductase subunit L